MPTMQSRSPVAVLRFAGSRREFRDFIRRSVIADSVHGNYEFRKVRGRWMWRRITNRGGH